MIVRLVYPVQSAMIFDFCGMCAYTEAYSMPLWWNWYTQQVEGLCPIGHLRSSRSRGTKKGAGSENGTGSFFG